MSPKDCNFLRRQAELCIALSRATFDLTLAGRLRSMADEFRAKAAEWEDDADDFQPSQLSGSGSLAGQGKGN
jgi:hypothetical protein